MLKKFQHDRDVVKVLNFDYGLWSGEEQKWRGVRLAVSGSSDYL
jgi:hypothetical protein